MEIISDKWGQCVARKNHVCGSCNKRIYSGEEYYYQFGKVDGELSIFKCHKDCHDAMILIPLVGWCEDEWTNVLDMDAEDMDRIKRKDPNLHIRLFGK